MSTLPFFLSQEQPCDYLPGQKAQIVFLAPDMKTDTRLYSRLAEQGFRRSGDMIYRPHCKNCSACIPVRIPVERFRPNRSQRRTLRKNKELIVRPQPPTYADEHYALYKRYLRARHRDGSMANSNPDDYIRFLSSDWCHTKFYEFRLDRQLIAVAVVDQFDDALSAVYTFFEPALPERSLGTYAVLWQILQAQNLNLAWLYLGFWIRACEKMAYKSQFRPLEIYRDGKWISFPHL